MRAMVAIFLMVTLAARVPAVAAANAPATGPTTRETARATRRVQVTEGMVRMGSQTLASEAQTAAVQVLKASVTGTDNDPESVDRGLRQRVQVVTTPDPITVQINIDVRDIEEMSPKRAAEAADAAVDAIRAAYRSTERDPVDQFQRHLEQLERKHEELQDLIKRASAEQREVTDAIRKEAGLADASPEGVHAIAQKLEAEYEAAQLELKAKSARHDALAEAIAKLSAQAEAKGNDDPVAAELAKVVEARDKDVARKQQMYGEKSVARAEVDEAMGVAAEARAKWLERKMAATAAAGGDAVAAWNKELLSLSIDLAELKARADALEVRLQQVSHALSALDQRASPQSLQQRIDDANRQVRDVENQMGDVERDLRPENRARVTVVESSDEAVPPKR